MSIQVRIHEEGALRNQRYAFTDKLCLVSELLQNARRAGAHRIDITYDDTLAILRVRDDGRGIDDFQKLLTFHESGWDAAIQEDEHPFGIGFSACLYAASRCIVASHGHQIDFLTAAALAREPIEVVEIPPHPHTVVELHDVRLPDLAQRLPRLIEGFPVPIRWNGRELARPFALGALAFQATPIGWVHPAGIEDGQTIRRTRAFLHGMCVWRPGCIDGLRANVVHLDPRQFVARLPDRTQLIDADEHACRIQACLTGLWRQVLVDKQSELEAEVFLDRYFDALRVWGHDDLLQAVDLLPVPACERIVGYPVQPGYGPCDYLAPIDRPLTRREIESGSVTVASLDRLEDDNAACWMFAKAMGYRILLPGYLPAGHWVHPHLRVLDAHAIRVMPIGEQCRTRLEGRWIWPEVVLCEAIHLVYGEDGILLRDEGVFHDDTLFIPSGEHSGEPVRQSVQLNVK